MGSYRENREKEEKFSKSLGQLQHLRVRLRRTYIKRQRRGHKDRKEIKKVDCF